MNMEFFEKAHITKDKHLSKDNKTSETVKKQLKQMLYGYKQNNNKIIQDSADIKTDLDDSSSVSGYSDLNLTNSSIDENLDETGSAFDDTLNKDTTNSDSNDENNSESNVSISEACNKEDSNCEDNEIDNETNSVSDSDASLASGMLDSSSNLSDTFDSSGELATKILNRLSIEKKNTKPNRKRKAKQNEISESETKTYDDFQTKSRVYLNRISEEFEGNSSTHSELSVSESESIPYISITAIDMPCQTFDSILGEYKHSTTKNLPSEHQNDVSHNTSLFGEQSLTVHIPTEDDVSSLVPELDEEPVIDEIDDVELRMDTIHDESADIDTTEAEETPDTEPIVADIDTLNNNFEIFYCTNSCIVIMKHPAELFIQGKVKIRALGGKVELFGYTLKDEIQEVYAPYYSHAHCVKTMENENCYYGLFNKLTNIGISVAKAEEIVTSLGSNDSIILLEKFQSTKVDFVEKNFMLSKLFLKPFTYNDPIFNTASDILECSLFSTRPFKCFNENPLWDQALQFASRDCSRGIVCGGKGVGKSTYLRYQVNKLLERGPVLVLDLDPGQCEFTVAGNVSATVVTTPLLGPNFTHLRKPNMMLNIGIINTMDNLRRYACAVKRLLFYCNNNPDFQTLPWIINTMGMTISCGFKLMVLIILLSRPTYLVQYRAISAKKCFEHYLDVSSVKWFYNDNRKDFLLKNETLPPFLDYSFVLAEEVQTVKSSYCLTPKHERFLNYLAYFSELTHIHNNENLLAIVPYEVCLKDLYLFSNIKLKTEFITMVINGKVVSLCQYAAQCDNARVFTLSDNPLLCHGQGLIRGVDREKELLYILTPVPRDQLSLVNAIIYADWTPEIGNMESYLPDGTVVPYSTAARNLHKHLMSSPRRRFNPLQLLKQDKEFLN